MNVSTLSNHVKFVCFSCLLSCTIVIIVAAGFTTFTRYWKVGFELKEITSTIATWKLPGSFEIAERASFSLQNV